MSSVAVTPPPATADSIAARPRDGWVRGPAFDRALVLGTAALGFAACGLVVLRPELWAIVLAIDVWLLGYHHVVAGWTRVAFDRPSVWAYRRELTLLPLAILAVNVAMTSFVGVWLLQAVYFHWQWWHYTRQGYGVERMHWRSAGAPAGGQDRLSWAMIYLVPVWALLQRSATSYGRDDTFLGLEMAWLPVPQVVATVAGVGAVGVMLAWTAAQVRDWRAGTLKVRHAAYVASHAAIFVVGYVVVSDPNHGWLAVNVWHNLQYLLVVWLFQANRFKGGVDPERRLLSTIAQPDAAVAYVLVCVAVTVGVFWSLELVGGLLQYHGLLASIVLFHTLNFHHYVMDTFIWKLRKKEVGGTLMAGASAK